MTGSDLPPRAAELLARYPGPVRLQPSPLKWLGVLALCLIFVAMLVHAVFVMARDKLDGICCIAALAVFFIYSMSLPHMFGRMWNGPPLLLLALADAKLLVAAGQAMTSRVAGQMRATYR